VSQPDLLRATIRREVAVARTPRVLQLEGLFDLPPTQRAGQTWEVELPLPAGWHVGLIVGPSGCGKSTIARELWPGHLAREWPWSADRSVVDDFPADLGIKDITALLCSVGFSSPPSWLKPFGVLSNGEQFRVTMARTLAEQPELAVVDEFTSVVDRDVAKVAAAAVAKAVRRRGQQFVAVTCHYDVAEWLEPDWVYQPHAGEFVAGRLLRRPTVGLEVCRVCPEAWGLFQAHHYLDTRLSRSAQCFAAFWGGRPVAFTGVVHMPGKGRSRGGWREHRTVCLPDFQGVGIGNALSEYVASLYAAKGKPYYSVTSNPGMIWHRARSPLWFMHRKPQRTSPHKGRHPNFRKLNKTIAAARLVAGFRYVGPARPEDARAFGLI